MNVIVTGAGRGIGFELVKYYINNGCKVIALSRNKSQLNLIKSEGLIIESVEFDSDNVKDDIENIANKYFDKLDILINNAGFLVSKPFNDLSQNEIRSIYQVNILSVFEIIKGVYPLLLKSNNPHIINVGSIGGVQGSVKFTGLSAYSSSKGALSLLTECLAEEFSETKIKCNCLSLGAVQTEMLSDAFPDYKAPIQPNEMAELIYKFSIDGYKYYNGKVISVSTSTP